MCWRLQLAGYRVQAVPGSVVYHHSGFSLPPHSFRKSYLNHRNNLVMLCKNLDLARLGWLLPVRLILELAATVMYLARRDWSSVAAPLAGLLWLVTHPLNLRRRRRQSRALLLPECRAAARLQGAGVYRGSVTWQYFARGARQSAALIPE